MTLAPTSINRPLGHNLMHSLNIGLWNNVRGEVDRALYANVEFDSMFFFRLKVNISGGSLMHTPLSIDISLHSIIIEGEK